MEVDQTDQATSAGVTFPVTICPTVILIISNRWTSICEQPENAAKLIVGALFGKRSGERIEVVNSVELKLTEDNLVGLISKEQFAQLMPDLEFVGWYTSGKGEPEKLDEENYEHIAAVYDDVILLKLNTLFKQDAAQPFVVWKPSKKMLNNEMNVMFNKLEFEIVFKDIERIYGEHKVCLRKHSDTNKVAAKRLKSLRYLLKDVRCKMRAIRYYLEETGGGELIMTRNLLRQISILGIQAPHFIEDCNSKLRCIKYRDPAFAMFSRNLPKID